MTQNQTQISSPVESANIPQTAVAPLAVRVVDNVWEFSSLREEWNAVAAASYATVFQTHEWLSRWWKHFGNHPSCALQILLFMRERQIVGIAPLFLESVTLAGRELHRALKLMGSGTRRRLTPCMPENYGPSDYLDIIARIDDEEDVADAFVRYLRDRNEIYDQAEFTNVPQDSILFKRVVPLLRDRQIPHRAVQSEICPRLSVPDSMEEYLHRREPGVRHRLHQARKAADQGKVFSIVTVQNEEEFEPFFRELVTLHQQRWNRLGYPGLFSNSWFEEFQHDVALEFLRSGNLWCKAAQSSGATVAMRLAFRFNNIYYDYLSGFDDRAAAAKRRPGLALLLAMIEDAITNRMDVVDFLRGGEKYKFELTEETVYNWTITIENKWSRSLPRIKLFRALSLYRTLNHRVRSETTLLRLQFSQHGPLQTLPHYFSFRWSRAAEHLAGTRLGRSVAAITSTAQTALAWSRKFLRSDMKASPVAAIDTAASGFIKDPSPGEPKLL